MYVCHYSLIVCAVRIHYHFCLLGYSSLYNSWDIQKGLCKHVHLYQLLMHAVYCVKSERMCSTGDFMFVTFFNLYVHTMIDLVY